MKGLTTFNTETMRFEEFPNPVTIDPDTTFTRANPIDADMLDGKLPGYYKDIAIVCDDVDDFDSVKEFYDAGKTIILSTEANKNGPFLHLMMFDSVNQAFYFSTVVGDNSVATVSLNATGWQASQKRLMLELPSGRNDMVKLDGNGQLTYAAPDVDYVTPGNGVPRGVIVMWSGNTVPSGWAICNGLNGTPDLRDRFIVSTGTKYTIGDVGGSDEVSLTTSQMPAHSHGNTVSFDASKFTMEAAGEHTHTYTQYSTTRNVNNAGTGYSTITGTNSGNTSSAGSHTHTFSTSGNPVSITNASTGNGASHENRPSYYALAFIMKL